MKILVSGSGGLIGSTLVPFLTLHGHDVVRLVRAESARAAGGIRWEPSAGAIEAAKLEGIDAAVHLAGENIAAGRWTPEQKVRIRESRVRGTRLLAETLAARSRPPQALVCASGVGYYGSRGDEILTEESAPGGDFLAQLSRDWEGAAEPATARGVRVVNLRFGMVLSGAGGALGKMLTPFRLGVGGVVGSGRQYMSWIALDDVVGVIHHALTNRTLGGPVNAVAPQPVTNREFTRALGRVLSRPTVFHVPAFAARAAFGEMADALLLASQRAEPARLLASGYVFQFPEVEAALRHMLGKQKSEVRRQKSGIG